MAEKERFYVHLVDHGDDRHTASLVPRWSSFFAPQPPSAHGSGLDSTLEQLADVCLDHFDESEDRVERYVWTESMRLGRVRVEVHPSTTLGETQVLGKRTVPFWVSYGMVPMESGGCRLVVPRFGDSMVLEDRSMAAEVIRSQWAVWLAGIQSRNLFELRIVGDESLAPWQGPAALQRRRTRRGHDDETVDQVLGPVAEEWVARARGRRLDPVVEIFDPADHELLYDRYPPASLLLVGERGVGKTAWVRALAFHFLRWQRDAERCDPPRLWATSADRLMAGMSYLGQWEERCLEVAEALSYEGDYLYVGRLHGIVKRRGHSSIGDLWLEDVAQGRISLIAECTPRELEACRRLNPGFLRPFRQIRLRRPGLRPMADYVRRYVARRAKNLELKEGAVGAMLSLLDVYQRHEVFPGKAFRFLDVLAQEAESRPEAEKKEKGRRVVYTETGLTRAFCRWSGLPEELVSDRHAKPVDAVAEELARGVVGQEGACLAAARILTRFKAKIHDPSKPLGTLLFVGPTGVGKTELAKQLATYMFGDPERMLRFDMSEYQAPGSARRLLAVGRGVRSLAQSIRRRPLSLILLDEIEKAHPDVFDLLLGVLGEGRLTDEDGLTVDFRMSILVLTSNLGVKHGADPGFSETRPGAADYSQAVKHHFRPELVNRLDEIVSFRYLIPADVEKIVDLMVAKARLRPGLRERNLRLHVEPGARRVLARRGFHEAHGARPLQRLIEDQVMGPLAVRLAEDPSFRDRRVYVVDDAAVEVPPGSEKIVVQ